MSYVNAQCQFSESEPNPVPTANVFNAEGCETVNIDGNLAGDTDEDFFVLNGFNEWVEGKTARVQPLDGESSIKSFIYLLDESNNLYARRHYALVLKIPYDIPNPKIGIHDYDNTNANYDIEIFSLGEEEAIDRNQVVYVDFRGYEDLMVGTAGPFTGGTFDITLLHNNAANWDNELMKEMIMSKIREIYSDYQGVIYFVSSDDSDPPEGEHTILYIGNGANGNFLGIAETVDHFNRNKDGIAILFGENIGGYIQWTDMEGIANTFANVGAHEIGHLLGLIHPDSQDTNSVMDENDFGSLFNLDSFQRLIINQNDYDFGGSELVFQNAPLLLGKLFFGDSGYVCEPCSQEDLVRCTLDPDALNTYEICRVDNNCAGGLSWGEPLACPLGEPGQAPVFCLVENQEGVECLPGQWPTCLCDFCINCGGQCSDQCGVGCDGTQCSGDDTCSNGQCIPPVTSTCEDFDSEPSGNEPTPESLLTASYVEITTSDNDFFTFNDECFIEDGPTVEEHWCVSTSGDAVGVRSCPDSHPVCSNGRCVAIEGDLCFDSDNSDVPPHTNDPSIGFIGYSQLGDTDPIWDECITGSPQNVLERYCFDSTHHGQLSVYCGSDKICEEDAQGHGRCVPFEEETCTDSDNSDNPPHTNDPSIDIIGYAQIGNGNQIWDECLTGFPQNVFEKYCSSDTTIGQLSVYCGSDEICEEDAQGHGRCVPLGEDECFDSDNSDNPPHTNDPSIDIIGYAQIGNGNQIWDLCIGGLPQHVLERYCSSPTTTWQTSVYCGSDEICEEDADGHGRCVSNCPADLNGDGVVGSSDLAILLGSWGVCENPDDCPADLDGDGIVRSSDLAFLLGNWGSCG